MPHASLIRGGVGSGAWTNHVLAHGEAEQIDQYLFEAISGDRGGSWAPTSVITIGGSGVTVASTFSLGASATFAPLGATMAGTLNLGASSQIDALSGSGIRLESGALMTAASGSTVGFVNGATLAIAGAVSLSATTVITSASGVSWNGILVWASGALTIGTGANLVLGTGSSMAVGGTATWATGSTLSLLAGSSMSIASTVTLTGAGHIIPRYATGSDANITVGVGSSDYLAYKGITLTTNRVVTLTSTGATEGATYEISMVGETGAGAHTIAVHRDDATAIIPAMGFGGAFICTARFRFSGGQWEYVTYSTVAS